MTNTLIYLWVEPLVINHQRSDKRYYFNYITEGDYINLSKDQLDEFIGGDRMGDIMDFADIDQNWNFGCVSAELTDEEPGISFTDSPKERKIKKKVQEVIKGEREVGLRLAHVDIQDGGQIQINLPALGVNDTIDLPAIWKHLEEKIAGKIQEGDRIELSDEDGNIIFEIDGGSFLNVGGMGTDMQIKGKDGELKGGVYLREKGIIDIGDYKRTFYMRIYTGNLLKAALKLEKSLMDITKQKLLT